ncbi:MAG: hypothetical protein GDA48_19230 [Hormoscilla sp. GM102CHS1]|nr:hypothetical protein [Hormoscilla sp. GM102CHS1]
MEKFNKYNFRCTLTFGDIYAQIVIWLIVIMISLASAMALMGTTRPAYALAAVGVILVLSLPFLLFAFVTTLLNHIELIPVQETATATACETMPTGKPAQATS